MSVVALLLCGGRGERLVLGVPKAAAPLAGRPLFVWSLESLSRCEAIESVIVVGPSRTLCETLAASGGAPGSILGWVEGGRERHESVARGLAALPPECRTVAIHDSARALASPELIGRVVADALEHGAAIAAIPLADTLKRASLGMVEDTIPRASLWCAQTPQVFRRDWLEQAHSRAPLRPSAATWRARRQEVSLCALEVGAAPSSRAHPKLPSSAQMVPFVFSSSGSSGARRSDTIIS